MRGRAKTSPLGGGSDPKGFGLEGRDDDLPPASAPSAADTVAYIADMAEQLAGMARSAGEPVLGYLLDMARIEAEAIARRLAG